MAVSLCPPMRGPQASIRSRIVLALAAIAVFGLVGSASFAKAHARDSGGQVARKATPEKPKAKSKPEDKTPRNAPVKKRTAEVRQGVQAKAVYCVNLTSQKTLVAHNPDQQLPIASLTKLVTAMVVLEKMPLHRKVRVPEQIRKVPKSIADLKPGDMVSVSDLLHGLLIASANDCAETLAAAYPGGRKAFIGAMNRKARSMGVQQTVFHTPSGLDEKIVTKKDGKKVVQVRSNVSTAREMARIARIAFENKTIRAICLKRHYRLASTLSKQGYEVKNTNKLLTDSLPVQGGKTGFTVRAGHCLASKFTPRGSVLLIVVLGSPDQFRDTRLVYHKALHATKNSAPKPAPARFSRSKTPHIPASGG